MGVCIQRPATPACAGVTLDSGDLLKSGDRLSYLFLHLPLNRADRPVSTSAGDWSNPTTIPSLEPTMQAAITDWGSAMMTSLAAAMALFLSAIPKIIGFAVILVVGWFIASLVDRGLAAILRRVRFNEF